MLIGLLGLHAPLKNWKSRLHKLAVILAVILLSFKWNVIWGWSYQERNLTLDPALIVIYMESEFRNVRHFDTHQMYIEYKKYNFRSNTSVSCRRARLSRYHCSKYNGEWWLGYRAMVITRLWHGTNLAEATVMRLCICRTGFSFIGL